MSRKQTTPVPFTSKNKTKPNLQYQNKKSLPLTEKGTEAQNKFCLGYIYFLLVKRPDQFENSHLVIPETGQSFPAAREKWMTPDA